LGQSLQFFARIAPWNRPFFHGETRRNRILLVSSWQFPQRLQMPRTWNWNPRWLRVGSPKSSLVYQWNPMDIC
jgi:hypothetical protein